MQTKNTQTKNEQLIIEELSRIQAELKAPKNLYNSFAKFKYRNFESVLEAFKKVQGDCALLMDDEVQIVGDRIYVVATATLVAGDGSSRSVKAWARESAEKRGMDSAQVTGSTSSYARKFAVSGLFAIDDSTEQDAGTTDVTDSDENVSTATLEKLQSTAENIIAKVEQFDAHRVTAGIKAASKNKTDKAAELTEKQALWLIANLEAKLKEVAK